jgi:hypothetical protein
MSDQWTDRLSEYLDGELDAATRAGLEAHLAGCAECLATLTELRSVARRAAALEDRPPARDLWPGIASRIGLETDELAIRRRARRVSFTVPQLAAAGLALIAVSAGLAWVAMRGSRSPSIAGNSPAPVVTPVAQSASWMPKVEGSADAAVTELRATLDAGRRSGRLDSTTVATIERSLVVIDSAIAQAKRALEADPGSAYLNHHLAETYRRKLSLVRQAARIAAQQT